MSLRLFVYYCALCGGWAALVGWMIGLWVAPENPLGKVGIMGLFLGLMVALGLSLVDATWNLGLRRVPQVLARVSVAMVVGAVAGLIGGMLGQALFQATSSNIVFVPGWWLETR